MSESNFIIVDGSGSAPAAIIPVPRCSVSVRQGTLDDLPFLDHLQKMHTHMVGFFPRKQMENYVAGGHVVIAMDQATNPIGYCIAKDQYLKRDDVGIVYQLNVLPLKQRHLVGAALIKAVFERAAYGCRLFSCWCAQDIQANWFWESIGFVPLAFRTGSRAKQRIHVFWQRRVRDNDDVTPYWFPARTDNGAVAEDRIVLPIPPGTHWRDPMPVLLPGLPTAAEPAVDYTKKLPGGAAIRRPEQPKVTKAHTAAMARSNSKHLGGVPAGKAAILTSNGVKYLDRADAEPEVQQPKPKRPPRPRAKSDPKHAAMARDLRDKFLEHIAENPHALLPQGKYDVSRARMLEAGRSTVAPSRLLDAA